MQYLIYIVLGLVAAIIGITLLIYFSLKSYYLKTRLKKGENQLDSIYAFTYQNIIFSLGGIENIKEIKEDNWIELLTVSQIKEKNLKKMGIKCQIKDSCINLTVKNFNLDNFFKRLKKDL